MQKIQSNITEGKKTPKNARFLLKIFHFRIQAFYFCEFHVQYFPFDKHVCLMQFKMRSASINRALLHPDAVKYEGPKIMSEFTIDDIAMERKCE